MGSRKTVCRSCGRYGAHWASCDTLRKHDFFAILNHVVMDGMERDKRKAAQQGPIPRYMARLDAAEAVCAYVDQMASLRPRGGGLWRLLEAWRKAKAESEEQQ